jgi:hypothetical protein
MKKKQKSVTVWLSEEEHDALTALASAQKKAPSAYATQTIRTHLTAKDTTESDTIEALYDLQKETRDAIRRMHEGFVTRLKNSFRKQIGPSLKQQKRRKSGCSNMCQKGDNALNFRCQKR